MPEINSGSEYQVLISGKVALHLIFKWILLIIALSSMKLV